MNLLKKCAVKFWYALIYYITVLIYLSRLRLLNIELKSQNFNTSMELLLYKNKSALKFFLLALILFLWGCGIVSYCIHQIKECVKRDPSASLPFIFISFITLAFLIHIICAISIPILQAVLSVSLLIGVGISVFS